MDYALTIRTELPYEQAVPRVKQALAEQGFGTLTEIDVTATLHEKLGADMERYVILGACNPALAQRALEVTREIGLLLPCNVVVREDAGGTLVQALDPGIIASVPDNPALLPVAEEAGRRLQAALAAVSAG